MFICGEVFQSIFNVFLKCIFKLCVYFMAFIQSFNGKGENNYKYGIIIFFQS